MSIYMISPLSDSKYVTTNSSRYSKHQRRKVRDWAWHYNVYMRINLPNSLILLWLNIVRTTGTRRHSRIGYL